VPGFEDGGPILRILRRHPDKNIDSEARIDADTGEVLLKSVEDVDASFIGAVLESILVGEPLSGNPLPWPYGPEPPSRPKEESHGLRFWEPDPASGVQVSIGCGDGGESGESCALVMDNGRSVLQARVESGELILSYERVRPEDEEAFGRLGEAVELAAR
jgi:hypothetical protein